MIVEDEPDIYALLLAMFDVWGIEGIAFVDGDETMRWISDVNAGMPLREPPELALLDIRLPGEISGMHIGSRLRQSPVLSDMVIVLITAFRLSPTDEAYIRDEAGADLFLYKPLPDLRELRVLLEAAIRKRRKNQAAAAQASAAAKSTNAAVSSAVEPPSAPPLSAPTPMPQPTTQPTAQSSSTPSSSAPSSTSSRKIDSGKKPFHTES